MTTPTPQTVAPARARVLAILKERYDEEALAAAVSASQEGEPPARPEPRHAWNDLWTIERPAPAAPADTETLLNGLIDECGFLMREVVFRLMCTAPDYDMAALYMNRAQSLAQTGANVAYSVAKLRKASAGESRRSITVEQVERSGDSKNRSNGANE